MIIHEIDKGKPFDWGKTSDDYAKYRDIYPQEFYEYILNLATLAEKMVPDKPAEVDEDQELEEHLKELDMHLVTNPALALDQSGELIQHMTKGECDVYSGIQYDNILSNMERISDQCSDLALAVMALTRSNIFGQEHQYIHDVHRSNSKRYQNAYQQEYDRYFGELQQTDQKQTE